MVKLKRAFALSLSLIIFLLAGFSFTFNNYLNSDIYETENISIKEISLSSINSNSLNENDKVYSAGYFSTTNFNQSNSNDYKVSANYLNGFTILSVDYDDSKDSIITSVRVNGVLTENNNYVETKAKSAFI